MSLIHHCLPGTEVGCTSEERHGSKSAARKKKETVLERFTKGIILPTMNRKHQTHPVDRQRLPPRRRRRPFKEPQVFLSSFKNTPGGDLQEFSISGSILSEFLNSLQKSNLDHLAQVNLERNLLYRNPATYRRLLAILPPESLENLTVRWNGIDANMAYKLAQRLPKYRNLHSLSLAENELGPKGLDYLLDVGQLYSLSRTVDLWDCNLRDDGASILSEYLYCRDINWKIKSLCLAGNDITDRGAILLAKGLSHGPNGRLRSLDLSSNTIENDGLKAIAAAAALSSLRELSLRNNRFDADGVSHVATLLLNGTAGSLRKLDLSGNTIGDSGVAWIGKAVQSPLCQLEELLLTNTRISNRGIEILATALENNTHLKRLTLDGNHPGVDRRGARFFVHCLAEYNKTLVTLTVLHRTYDNHLLNDKLDEYLECNRCGWHHVGDLHVPHAAWPMIWAKTKQNTELLYQFMRRRPDLLLVR